MQSVVRSKTKTGGLNDEYRNFEKMDFAESSGSALFYPFDKVSQAFRLDPDSGFSGKILYLGKSFTAAFASMVLSFSPLDLLIGIAGAALIRLIIYVKGKNVKKYRKGTEYGSVRWGSAADIRLYIDPVFDNNILLTRTERLMMSNRPKNPKYARNKNVW